MTTIRNFRPTRRLLLLGLAFGTVALKGVAQEIFREFVFTYGADQAEHFSEVDPGSTRDFKGAPMGSKAHHVPKPLTLDLGRATRAELSVEYWGGHSGTTGQRFQINDHAWADLPQPVGTPEAPQRFFRMLHGNNAVPIPLAHLREGANTVQFAAGPQLKGNWGFYWIYDFTVRVSYDPARPHPTGEIVLPRADATFGDSLVLEARATSPNGPIARVEFIGEYDDFDWDGNGVWREWQFTTHHGVLQHHLGTATGAPWRVTWDARWLPDQTQPVRLRARITDTSGTTYLTKPMALTGPKRADRSVRMFKSADVPEGFSVRLGREKKCTIEVPGDLAHAKSARLVLSTWNGSTDEDCVHELQLNGERLANRFGRFHDYALSTLDVPLARLKSGTNEIAIVSTYAAHALEINWPGPVLLVEYVSPPR